MLVLVYEALDRSQKCKAYHRHILEEVSNSSSDIFLSSRQLKNSKHLFAKMAIGKTAKPRKLAVAVSS